MILSAKRKKERDPLKPLNSFVAQFYLFYGEKYIGWDCFDKAEVIVGSGPEADLVLRGPDIDKIQSTFTITDKGIKVADAGTTNQTCVNNRQIKAADLGPLDFVKIGQYTIKVKLKKLDTEFVGPADSQPTDERPLSKSTGIIEQQRAAEKRPDKQAPAPKKKRILHEPDSGKTNKRPSELFLGFENASDAMASATETPAKAISSDDTTFIVSPHSDKTEKISPPAPDTKPPVPKSAGSDARTGSFPPGFFSAASLETDSEDEEDDFPAPFTLRDKLTGIDRNAGRKLTPDRRYEVIKFRDNNLVSVNHIDSGDTLNLIDRKASFCRIVKKEKGEVSLIFSEPLHGKININHGEALETQKIRSLKGAVRRQPVYRTTLPEKKELTLSDGVYDYILRPTYIKKRVPDKPIRQSDLTLKKRITSSPAFRHGSRAALVHLVIFIVLSFTIEMPDIEEFKNPETHFVVIDTENIHRPVKPKPKPKPVIRKKVPEKTAKRPLKESTKTASLRKKQTKRTTKPKAGGGHKGNLVNRDINQVGLLQTLGIKKGISVKSNEALAAVTNIDAVSSTHSKEARVQIGGIVGDLGEKNIAIPTGDVVTTRGSTGVLRSAGIGGKGNVAALSSGKTGNRAVQGTVRAPLTKKVRFKGGGISRDAVAKVINSHIDEISYCYESALINNPSLMGKVVFEWKILPSGKVGEVKIKSSTLRSREIHSCIKSAIRSWVFPKPKGGAAIISYPFVFDVSGF